MVVDLGLVILEDEGPVELFLRRGIFFRILSLEVLKLEGYLIRDGVRQPVEVRLAGSHQN